MILFLSKYPVLDEELRDGFYQRVENIDNFFRDDERTYLNISLFKNAKKQLRKVDKRTELSCNFFLHFFTIFKLFQRTNIVYIQSIFNALNALLLIMLLDKKYILDVHGAVPEELDMHGKKLKSIIFNYVEKKVFNKLSIAITVTERMTNHYSNKYSKISCKFIEYAILPSHLKKIEIEEVNSDRIEVIYSGNAQVWQNVDLMLKTIKNNENSKIHYTILTGDLKTFKSKIVEYGINTNNITLNSVRPTELGDYYKNSHYGFILRDDILVNNVACPTKIVEYLNYGIIPIVLSEKIGDFKELGYEYLGFNEFNENIIGRKSSKNGEVINLIYKKNDIDLRKLVLTQA